jgi:pseudomonalisin
LKGWSTLSGGMPPVVESFKLTINCLSKWQSRCALPALLLALAAVPLSGQGLRAVPGLGFLPGGEDRLTLRGNVHPAVRDLMPLDRADPGLPMERMILSLRMRPEAKAQLEQLLVDQQDAASPRYHRWLTPDEFAARFGPSPSDLATVSGWLRDQGFTIDQVARGGMSIQFSGDVGRAEGAFRTPIMEYLVQGVKRQANAADPSIPAGLAPMVAGVVSLHNIPRKAANSGLRPLAPQYTYSDGSHYLGPGDFATIYDVNPLYDAGIDGAGVSIAIAGRTHPNTANWQTFRTTMGLPDNPPAFILNGADPGDLGSDEDGEADLDVEWSGAVARNASIEFVCSKSTTTDGIDLSAQDIVDNKLADIINVSFSLCESALGSGNSFYNNLWQQAAAEGISVFVASGDSGAAGCDSPSSTSGTVQGVNGMGSTPYNTCVGGTEFNEGSGSYWSLGSSPSFGTSSALSYIPEVVWNEAAASGADAGLWSSGGGVSELYPKPSWQVAPGVPGGDHRYVPDVSLSAAGHDGYLVYSTGSQGNRFYAVGGTSASSPSFAGLMALIVQKAGGAQGNANPTLYQLGNAQYTTGIGVFHDITAGNNSVPGVAGFSAGTGYDEATGLGSVDATALLNNWVTSVTTPVSSVGLLPGRSAVFTAQVTGATSPGLTWSCTGGASIIAGTPSTSATFSASTAGTYTVTATSAAAPMRSASITVLVHEDLMGSGTTVTGLDILDVLGHLGQSGAAADVTGDGVVTSADLTLMLQLLGWQ